MIRIAITVAIIIIFSQPAMAASCHTDLGKNPKVSDIQRVFNCLNNKIEELENRLLTTQSISSSGKHRASQESASNGKKLSFEKHGVEVSFERCSMGGSRYSSTIECVFKLLNKTKSEKNFCIESSSRIVLDTGQSLNRPSVKVAASRYQRSRAACDMLPPLVRTYGAIAFKVRNHRSSRAYGRDNVDLASARNVQYLLLDCGPGCKLEGYNIPLR